MSGDDLRSQLTSVLSQYGAHLSDQQSGAPMLCAIFSLPTIFSPAQAQPLWAECQGCFTPQRAEPGTRSQSAGSEERKISGASHQFITQSYLPGTPASLQTTSLANQVQYLPLSLCVCQGYKCSILFPPLLDLIYD